MASSSKRRTVEELTTTQISKAQLWTGSLTEACVILDMPFRRAWNYVSGKPISIRPLLKGPKAEIPGRSRSRIDKNGYTFVELLNLRLAETLLSAGLSGRTVQPLVDCGWVTQLSRAGRKADAMILIIYHDIEAPTIMEFPPGKEQDFEVAFHAALQTGAARCVLSAGSMMRDVLRRTAWHQERRRYVAKSPREIVQEALARGSHSRSLD